MRTSAFVALSLLVLLTSPALAQRKKKPAPADLVRTPFVPADVSKLSKGAQRLEIFLLMGQSNMKGRGVMPKKPLRDPRIVMMHKTTDGWYHARHPLHLVGDPKDFKGADNAGVGPGLAFAQAILKAQPGTRVALLPCAQGGSSIGQWRKGKPLYDQTIRKAKLALSQGPKGKTRIAGALWLQGESDSTTTTKVQAYRGALGTLIDNLRKDLDIADLPFVACTIGEMKPAGERAKINAVLLDLPKIRPHTACVDSRTFAKSIGDKVHFDTATQEEHGRRYAAAYLKLVAKKP